MAVTDVRTFDGVDDLIVYSNGAAGQTAPFTILVIARISATTTDYDGIVTGQAGAGNFFYRAGSGALGYWEDDSSGADEGPTWVNSDGFCLIGVSKQSGSVAPRYHKYVYDTSTWTHANGSTATVDCSTPAGHQMSIVTSLFKGDIACGALWDDVLSDAEVEAKVATWGEWLATPTPMAAWPLNQASVATPVPDDTGNGANQSAITGTTVTSVDIPGWSFAVDLSNVPGPANNLRRYLDG